MGNARTEVTRFPTWIDDKPVLVNPNNLRALGMGRASLESLLIEFPKRIS